MDLVFNPFPCFLFLPLCPICLNHSIMHVAIIFNCAITNILFDCSISSIKIKTNKNDISSFT